LGLEKSEEVKKHRTAGWIAAVLMTTITSFWMYWSFGEMYHEGWWGAWYNRLPYLVPGAGFLVFTLLAVRWPRVGGWLLILVGTAFSLFFLDIDFTDGKLTIGRDLAGTLLCVPVILMGVLFLIDGRQKKRGVFTVRYGTWWRRDPRLALALGIPMLLAIGVSAAMLPIVLTRQDDGDRSARLIEGNGVSLIWAPEGPGWNNKQPWGGYPSWQSIALYGVVPIGFEVKPGYGYDEPERLFSAAEDMSATNVCRYLNEEGTALETEPVNIWRMPTVEELVLSLVRHGENAGCVYQGEYDSQVECAVRPDKESPLWSTDLAPVYYWALEEYDERDAYFVSYNGFVNTTFKAGGNPRHSYRCVREP